MKKRRMLRIGELREIAIAEKKRIDKQIRDAEKKKRVRLKEKVARDARRILKAAKVTIVKRARKTPDYTGQDILMFNDDCKYLKHFVLMRGYMKFKHGLSLEILEMLLYLYPDNYFSGTDYRQIPILNQKVRLYQMLQAGYIQQVSAKRGPGCIYTLSLNSKKLVRKFYGLLSGEIQIPEEDIMKKWDSRETDEKKGAAGLIDDLLKMRDADK